MERGGGRIRKASRIGGSLWVKCERSLLLAAALCGVACTNAPQARFPSVDSALEQLQQRTECSRAIQGEAALAVRGPFTNVRGKMMYVAHAKDQIRFDLYSDFGVTLSTLTSDGQKFSLYSLDQKAFWYGPARTCNLKRFTRVAIPPFALVELLRGRPPVLVHEASAAQIRYSRPLFSKGRYVVEIEGEHETKQRLHLGVPEEDFLKPLAEQRLRLLSVRVKQGGKLLYRVELSDYREARRQSLTLSEDEVEMGITPPPPSGPECAAELPGRLSFAVPNTGHKLVIENREVFHNPALMPGVFQQPLPAGVRSEQSICVD